VKDEWGTVVCLITENGRAVKVFYCASRSKYVLNFKSEEGPANSGSETNSDWRCKNHRRSHKSSHQLSKPRVPQLLSRTTMSKPTKKLFPVMLKKLFKHKSSSLSTIQQEHLMLNHSPSLSSLAGHSATETTSLITHSIAISVAVQTANATSPSNSETATTSRSVAKDTAVNALKLLLKVLSDIPGPGVKAALSGLLTIIERVQVCWQNI
jgi:hypothetical protein